MWFTVDCLIALVMRSYLRTIGRMSTAARSHGTGSGSHTSSQFRLPSQASMQDSTSVVLVVLVVVFAVRSCGLSGQSVSHH